MSARNVWTKVFDKKAVAATGSIKTDRLTNLMLVCTNVGDGVDSTFVMTVYGSMDAAGTIKSPLGIMPSLTGVRDAAGNITFAWNDALFTAAYEIPGVHPYIFIDIGTVTATINVTIWVGGTEDY